jgi:hypothetical protein
MFYPYPAYDISFASHSRGFGLPTLAIKDPDAHRLSLKDRARLTELFCLADMISGNTAAFLSSELLTPLANFNFEGATVHRACQSCWMSPGCQHCRPAPSNGTPPIMAV